MIPPSSDLDIMLANWRNMGALAAGATVAVVTVVAFSALFNLAFDQTIHDRSHTITLATASIVGTLVGAYFSHQVIGLVAHGSLFALSIALTACAGGAFSGLTFCALL